MLNNMQIVFGVCEAENGHGISVPQSGTDAWRDGCPRTAHCTDVGLLKTVPVCFLDRKRPCVICILLKMNDLNCVENNMLMHGIQCLNMMFELYMKYNGV